jgi:predicted lipoprotein with Yx(FWY)xxD motif
MRPKLILAATIMVTALAGCGSSSSSARDDPGPLENFGRSEPVTTTATVHGPRLRVVDSDYGPILADGHGRALYLFTADRGKGSDCSGDCATAWPPYIVKSKPTALSGVRPRFVGTTRRGDGKLQATYAGHPVYYHEGDRSPGQVNCQAALEFGGYWYVLRSNGKAVH